MIQREHLGKRIQWSLRGHACRCRLHAPRGSPCSRARTRARPSRRLQNFSHRARAFSGCCPPTPPRSCVFPAGRVRRPALPLPLVQARWNPGKKRSVYAAAP